MSDITEVWANNLPTPDELTSEYSILGFEQGSNQGIAVKYEALKNDILDYIDEKEFVFTATYKGTIPETVGAIKTTVDDIPNTYQTKLGFDATPTEGSENVVTSDGIYKYMQKLIDTIYPVGSIYISMDNDFDPNDAWGGTTEYDSSTDTTYLWGAHWSKLQGCFLRGSTEDDDEEVGAAGGQDVIYLSPSQLPKHYHGVKINTTSGTGEGGSSTYGLTATSAFGNRVIVSSSSNGTNTDYGFYYGSDGSTKTYLGSSQAGVSLLPSYVVCNIWYRYQ